MLSVFIVLFAVLYAIIAYRSMRWALFILVCGLPAYIVRFSVLGALPMTLLEVMILVVGAVWLVRLMRLFGDERQAYLAPLRDLLGMRWLAAAIGVFLAAAIISTSISVVPLAAIGVLKAFILEPLLVGAVVLSEIRRREDLRLIVAGLGLSAVAVSVFAVAQWVFAFGLIPPWDGIVEPIRATSFYRFPNAIGLFVAPIAVLFSAFVLAWLERGVVSVRWVVFAVGVVVVSVAGMFAAMSRGALLATIVGVLVVGLLGRLRLVVMGVFIVGLVLAMLYSPIRTEVVSVFSGEDVSTDVRSVLWVGSWRIVQVHPVFGIGFSSFPFVYEEFKEARHVELLQYPHFIVLNFWLEMGLLGLLSFFAVVCWVVRRGVEVGRRVHLPVVDDFDRAVVLGLVGCMVAIVAHGFVDVPYFKNDLAVQFWLLVSLMVVLYQLSFQDKRR
jgi:putative inorganic carbon (hco3(-)) transporter